MMVWIDAVSAAACLRIFGLTVTERHLQALMRLDQKPTRVIVDVGARDPAELRIPQAIRDALPITWSRSTASLSDRLRRVFRQARGHMLLVLDGTALGDQRLHAPLARARTDIAVFSSESPGETGKGEEVAMLVLHEPDTVAVPDGVDSIASLAHRLTDEGRAERLTQDRFDGFIRKLRRSLPFYLFKVEDERKAAKAQRFLFWSNYKGSTDLFTRYVYPPLVWLMLRPLAHARIHPNIVTLISILLTLGAVPFFATGQWVIGFAMAYGMSVLDSVDGKLGRLTFTDSRLGHYLDHGLDLIHPPLWYLAWAYGIGLGAEGLHSPLGYAAGAMLVFYVLDRLILKIYPRFFQRAFHTHSKLDATVRSFIARRNINLPIFLIGCVFGVAREAFFLIVAWQIATACYHAARIFWIIVVQKAYRNTNAKPVHVASELG